MVGVRSGSKMTFLRSVSWCAIVILVFAVRSDGGGEDDEDG